MSFWSTTEADIQTIVLKLKAGFLGALAEGHAVIQWVAANQAEIVNDLQTALGFAQQAGVVDATEIRAAQAAVAGLQAIAAAHNAGATDIKAVATAAVAAYAGYKGAQGAVAAATAAAVAAPVATPAAV